MRHMVGVDLHLSTKHVPGTVDAVCGLRTINYGLTV